MKEIFCEMLGKLYLPEIYFLGLIIQDFFFSFHVFKLLK